MDDAYLGGERGGGRRRRGSPGKTPFVAAVETSADGKAHRVKLRRVRRFTKKVVKAVTERIVAPGAHVVTDGFRCFNGVADAGRWHQAIVTGSGRKAARHPAFRAVDTVLANIKTAIAATFRAGAKKHTPRRRAECAHRFNRRYDLPAMNVRLGWVAMGTPPMPYRLLMLAEDHGSSGTTKLQCFAVVCLLAINRNDSSSVSSTPMCVVSRIAASGAAFIGASARPESRSSRRRITSSTRS